jgi:hypothetical protein
LLEIFGRESVNQRNAKQYCAYYLDGGRVQFRFISSHQGWLLHQHFPGRRL